MRLQAWEQDLTLEEALRTLQGAGIESKNVLKELAKALLLERSFKTYQIPEVEAEKQETLLANFMSSMKLSSPEAFETWLKKQNLTREELKLRLAFDERLSQLKKIVVPDSVSQEAFARVKHTKEQVVFGLIRLEEENLAKSLYRQIKEEQKDFAELASQYSKGPEAKTGGLVGPKRLMELNPELRIKLQKLQSGELSEPFTLDGKQWLLVRLIRRDEAQLTSAEVENTRASLFDQWIERQLHLADVKFTEKGEGASKDSILALLGQPAESTLKVIEPSLSSSAAICLNALLEYYQQPQLSFEDKHYQAEDIDHFAQKLESYGFVTQKKQLSWPEILNEDPPFVLETQPGAYDWVTGIQANSALVERFGQQERFAPNDINREDKFNVLISRQTAGHRANNGQDLFTLPWYGRLFAQNPLLSGQLLIAAVMIQIFSLASPLLYMVIFDRVYGHQNLKTLDVISIGMVLVLAFDFITRQLRAYVLSHQLERVDQIATQSVVQQLLSLPLGKLAQEKIRYYIERFGEINKTNEAITSMVMVSTMDLGFSGIIVIALLLLNWQLALISLAAIVPMVALTLWMSPQIKKNALAFHAGEQLSKMRLAETLEGKESVLALNANRTAQWGIIDTIQAHYQANFKARFDQASTGTVQQLVAQIGSLATLYFGAHFVLEGKITFGVYLAINMLSKQVLSTVQKFLASFDKFQEAITKLPQYNELFKEGMENQESSGLRIEKVAGRIECEGLKFRYQPESPWVLNGLSLTLEAGQTVVLTGPSGAGKTTLVRLLQRQYQLNQGHISLDGYLLSTFDIGNLRQHVGVSPQKPVLFGGTIRENLLMGNPRASTQDMLDALAFVQLDGLLLKLPEGLDTKLAMMAANLSGGQAASLALARTLLMNPSVLILDEALTSLDPASRGLIFNRIIEAYRDRTLILVTDYEPVHQRADKIVVLNDGMIVEEGTYSDLVRSKGYYGHLYTPLTSIAGGRG